MPKHSGMSEDEKQYTQDPLPPLVLDPHPEDPHPEIVGDRRLIKPPQLSKQSLVEKAREFVKKVEFKTPYAPGQIVVSADGRTKYQACKYGKTLRRSV